MCSYLDREIDHEGSMTIKALSAKIGIPEDLAEFTAGSRNLRLDCEGR